MATIRSFVSPSDIPKLFDILSKIRDGTMKKEVSVLVIAGRVCSGKSTLIDVMKRLSQSCSSIDPKTIISSRVKSHVLECCNTHLIRVRCCGENPSLERNIEGIHDWIEASTGKLYRPPNSFQEPYLMKRIDPGVFIFESFEIPSIENFKKHKRMPLILELPNWFNCHILFQKIDRQSHIFSRELVVDKCIREFSVLNTVNARKASLFFLYCVDDLPFPLEIVVIIAKKVWGTREERCWLF